ncbi:hypothetical protein GV819_22285 [Pseudomonas sp. Fl5BN2]|uniref:hypothetical protein n=1 Tax=unclassified Pseudomonas TaxID=196821 RepID=UPI001378E741|nr:MULTISPECIES: hypothetical protein [unclassified Pseudomonas]NBF05020.1 hypothetical protein [Pseudomonas sp. Fl5BN2]NBF09067.1 hypothetical protein [Pseudomonas sp. Fl4BN1]
MINLNPPTRLAELFTPPPGTATLEPSDDGETLVLSRSSANSEAEALLLAKKKRIRQLKKQIELLQHKLLRAKVRLETVKGATSSSETGHAMARSSAQAQVMAYSTALSMAQSALFQAQSGTLT